MQTTFTYQNNAENKGLIAKSLSGKKEKELENLFGSYMVNAKKNPNELRLAHDTYGDSFERYRSYNQEENKDNQTEEKKEQPTEKKKPEVIYHDLYSYKNEY